MNELFDVNFWNAITVIFGIVATIMSSLLAGMFFKSSSNLSFALGMMFGAEALAGLCTTIFSVGTVVAGPEGLPIEVQILLRWLIFGGALVTSIHLWWKIRRLS